MRAAVVLLVLAGAAEAQTFTVRPAFVVKPAVPEFVVKPAPEQRPLTQEEVWHAQGWRRDAAGQWYRWLSTPVVTPAWSGVPGRQYAVPATLPRGGNC